MTSVLGSEEVRDYYDRFGAKQDQQGFYEDAAFDLLIRHAGFSDARSVLEIGCGTGKLAARLLSDHLPPSAHYAAIDVSTTMVGLAKQRLSPWADRSEVFLCRDASGLRAYGGPYDRIVSTYVFDLLSRDEITQALDVAHGAMQKGGLLCLAGLTKGVGFFSSVASTVWGMIHSAKPSLVGGCRPLVLSDLIADRQWKITHRDVVVSMTIPSEVIVAEAL